MVPTHLDVPVCCSGSTGNCRRAMSTGSAGSCGTKPHSLMHIANVNNTLPLLWAATYPCFRSSDNPIKKPIPIVTVAAASTILCWKILAGRGFDTVDKLWRVGARNRETRHCRKAEVPELFWKIVPTGLNPLITISTPGEFFGGQRFFLVVRVYSDEFGSSGIVISGKLLRTNTNIDTQNPWCTTV